MSSTVNETRDERVAHKLTQAMERDVQAQRLLIVARARGETSEVYWADNQHRRGDEA